jgi:uncharacterized repeat protein (TIGR01451 family)
VTWTIAGLAASGVGHEATLSIVAFVDTVAVVTNTATFTQTTPNGSGGNTGSSNIVTLTPSYADLSLVKTVADPSPQTGGNDTYEITVSNKGPDAASSVVVTDPLPAGLTFVSDSVSMGSVSESNASGDGEITWEVGTLASGASATLDAVVTVTAQTGSITNSAQVTDASYDPTGQTKTATAVAVVEPPTVVPPNHTGEPWSGSDFWIIVSLFGVSGLAIIEVSRRRSRRNRSTAR